MAQIIISTTFRDFDGSSNDKMQMRFLYSLKRQTFQDFVLVATIFGEKKVEKIVKKILGEKSEIIQDTGSEQYQFSLSKTFMNGVDYGLENHARILVDCSSDIVLQKNFLDVVNNRIKSHTAGISHPNIFREITKNGEITYAYGSVHRGIDVRFYALDLFQDEHIYGIFNEFPSYDYGAGIETILCGIAIKYAQKRYNIFMESKVIKEENIRNGRIGIRTKFMREGAMRNIPVTERFMQSEKIPQKYMSLLEMNQAYKITKWRWFYFMLVGREIVEFRLQKWIDRLMG